MQARHLEAVTFSAKAAVSALAGVLCYRFIHLPGMPWVAAVSAVIVTQPTLHSSLKASLLRVAANLTGAVVGLLLGLLLREPLAAMTAGILITGIICYALKQDDLLRPAFVAVILVTLAGENGEWEASRNRLAGVVVGCLCAAVVGFVCDKASKRIMATEPTPPDKTAPPE